MSENQIISATSVEELMQILHDPPYNLPVPLLKDIPEDTQTYVLWGLKLTVAKDGPGTYTATVDQPWDVIKGLVRINQPKISVTVPTSNGT